MHAAYDATDFSQFPDGWSLQLLSNTREQVRRWHAVAERKVVVDQAITLISEIYAHLPLKAATEAIDPVEHLRLLSLRLGPHLSMGPARLADMSEWQFHARLSWILTTLRDAHTVYLAPGAEKQRLAFLPLLVEECDGDRYVVTKIAEGFESNGLEVGARITHWNGQPIDDYVESAAEVNPGANPVARHARAVARMTCRWIGNGILPPEDWVVLTHGSGSSVCCPWLVADVSTPNTTAVQGYLAITADTHAGDFARTHAGDSARTHAGDFARTHAVDLARTHAGESARTHALDLGRTHATDVAIDSATELIRRLKTALYASRDDDPLEFRDLEGGAGYLRVWTFDVPDADDFVADARALIEAHRDAQALVIDMRGNPGGLIAAAHGLLQLLTSERLDPITLEYRATPRTLALADRLAVAADAPADRAALVQATESIDYALGSGQDYSDAAPFEEGWCWSSVKQVYAGPQVLIVDPLSYSATEIFAAQFQDLGLGPVLGTGTMTGGGGGSPWSYERLAALLELPRLTPDGAAETPSFEVTVRRVVRDNGSRRALLEGIGVTPDDRYVMTERDVLAATGDGNRGLIEHALQLVR